MRRHSIYEPRAGGRMGGECAAHHPAAAPACTLLQICYHMGTMYKIYHIDPRKSQEPQWAKILKGFGTGPSPGGAASYLGITRSAVNQAIDRGALRACKIYEGDKHSATIIDPVSLDAYKELRDLTGGRIPYRARAI